MLSLPSPASAPPSARAAMDPCAAVLGALVSGALQPGDVAGLPVPATLARGLVAGLGSEYRVATGDEVRAVAERLRATASELAVIAAERDRASERGAP